MKDVIARRRVSNSGGRFLKKTQLQFPKKSSEGDRFRHWENQQLGFNPILWQGKEASLGIGIRQSLNSGGHVTRLFFFAADSTQSQNPQDDQVKEIPFADN